MPIDCAFGNCNELKIVTIGSKVMNIGDSAFKGCSKLEKVIWNAENCLNAGSYSHTFYNGKIFVNNNTIFIGCSELTDVTIGENVEAIPDYAFYDCSGLTSITIPDGVASIGDSAFQGCSGLTNITIPDSVIDIGDNVFRGCSDLTSIIIGKGVTEIGDSMFEGCSGLTNITIPDSVRSIGNYALEGCCGLASVIIGKNVSSIGQGVFSRCSSLKSVEFKDTTTWYKTDKSDNMENKRNGVLVDVSDSANNAKIISEYYWYKM